MGKDNNVGKKGSTGNAGHPLLNGSVVTDGPPKRRIERANSPKTKRICGAMSQQRGDAGRGNESAPQKLVQLVGYRDPKPRPEPWARTRPAPMK